MSKPKTMNKMTHLDLVEIAKRWLRKRCNVVITEMTSGIQEQPDAIGWEYGGHSIVVECKTSRSDFLYDKNKTHNRFDSAMGDKRFYLAPKGLIKPEELSEKYGLLECVDRKRNPKIIRQAQWNKGKSAYDEITLLLSAFRRIGGLSERGVSVRAYQYHSKNRATLGIQNQPEISMKNIRGWADGIQENIKDHEDWSYLPDGMKDFVEEEFGIKVKK